MTKILVLEDDRKLQNLIKAYLESTGYNVLLASSLKEARSILDKEVPSLVILDLMLPDGNGESFSQEIKEIGEIPIIMVTAKSSEEDKLLGFSLGADDYVSKPFSPKELIARVKAVLKRYEKETQKQKVLSFDSGKILIKPENFEVVIDGKTVDLSRTEFKLLLVLATSPNKVFSRMDLVEKALGYEFEGYERTVDAHIKNLRHKIGDDPKKPHYIQTVFGIGYKFLGKKDASNN